MHLARKLWNHFITRYTPVIILYSLVVLVVSLQQWLSHPKNFGGEVFYPDYNNFVIFRQSFVHLVNGQDLYQHYLTEHWDLFKYSPTFALLFGPLVPLPDLAGVLLWTAFNAMMILWAVKRLPVLEQRIKIKILLFILIELITSLQNMQSNALIAALIIMAFGLLEEGNYFAGILCITATVFIKIFGVLAFGLLIFYPNKPKLILYTAASMAIFLLLPLIVVSPRHLLDLYASWWHLLSNDHSSAFGLSMMGWLKTWFHLEPGKNLVVILGLFFLGLPLLRWDRYKDFDYRLLLLSGLLMWLVIFNHMAESPTFIIAACGAAIWYFSKTRNGIDHILILLFFVFTILSQTDIFPASFRTLWFQPYVVKVVPAIFIWLKITYEAMPGKQLTG